MNRRNFLSRLGIGTAAVAATTAIPSAPVKEAKLEDGSLRPMCSACKTRMLVRYDAPGPYAFCPLTTCKRYGIGLGLQPREDVAIHFNDSPGISQKLIDSYNEQVPKLVEYTEKKERKYRVGKRSAR